jgi:phospholipase C
LIVVSPFTKRNFVSHATADYTAILKLIEERFNLGPLSARDAAQIDMASPTDPTQTFFDFVNVPWATPPVPPAQHKNLQCILTPPTP